MRKVVLCIRCAGETIKNKFFNRQNQVENVACEQWKEVQEESATVKDQISVEEYLKNYQLTTRWQTL